MSVRTRAVLIIEHDAYVRQLYTRTLHHTFEIVEAQTVSDCERAFRDYALVSVIIEPHRPDGLGGSLLDTVRMFCIPRHIPITVCSVLDAHHGTILTGIHKHLVKPVAPERLRTEILRNSPLTDQSNTQSSPA
jgi:response regulator of citrate/malate metabolism